MSRTTLRQWPAISRTPCRHEQIATGTRGTRISRRLVPLETTQKSSSDRGASSLASTAPSMRRLHRQSILQYSTDAVRLHTIMCAGDMWHSLRHSLMEAHADRPKGDVVSCGGAAAGAMDIESAAAIFATDSAAGSLRAGPIGLVTIRRAIRVCAAIGRHLQADACAHKQNLLAAYFLLPHMERSRSMPHPFQPVCPA